MRCPCPIQWDQPPAVDSPAEDIFWHEFPLVPYNKLASLSVSVLPLANTTKPVPVRVIAVLEPFVDEHVGCIVVQSFAHEFDVA